MGESVTAFIIGDPHFKASKVKLGEEFIERCVDKARNVQPDFIVCLGDTLDTNNVIYVHPLMLAEKFLDELTSIAPTYLLIGNHDYINQSQYLTNNHGFGAFKKWPNLTVVDKPTMVEHKGKKFIMAPYVPKGRFVEALDECFTTSTDYDSNDGVDIREWLNVTAIFAHQEFMDCKMGAHVSEDGDEWDEDWPPVFSGHIHEEQLVGENVYYPGSSVQHGYGDTPNKKVWAIHFRDEEDDDDASSEDDEHSEQPFTIEKFDLGLRWKKLLYLDVDTVKDFDCSIAEEYDVKIEVRGEREALAVFKKSQLKTKLTRLGVKLAYNPVASVTTRGNTKLTKEDTSFDGVLARLLKTKTKKVQQAYKRINVKRVCEVEF